MAGDRGKEKAGMMGGRKFGKNADGGRGECGGNRERSGAMDGAGVGDRVRGGYGGGRRESEGNGGWEDVDKEGWRRKEIERDGGEGKKERRKERGRMTETQEDQFT